MAMTRAELIKSAADAIRVASDYTIKGEYYARALAEADLLADPQERAELAELRKRIAFVLCLCDAINRVSGLAAHREIASEIRAALRGGQPAEKTDGPQCRYCRAGCSEGRSWDGGALYACTRCSEARAARVGRFWRCPDHPDAEIRPHGNVMCCTTPSCGYGLPTEPGAAS